MNNSSLRRIPSAKSWGISDMDDNLLENILSRLPAKSFASAACVSRTWNDICSRILYYPKFVSAFSLNISLHEAVNEVVGKVLCEPIRPHFAILSICPTFNLDEAHGLVIEKMGSRSQLLLVILVGLLEEMRLLMNLARLSSHILMLLMIVYLLVLREFR
ncbi:hypothetical protein RDABS01_026301 [Bienertia sinuspersici]